MSAASDLTLGAATAQTLFHLWRGAPAVILSAPPGAGKTSLIETIAPQLAARANLKVSIATQTSLRAIDIANRLAKAGRAVNLLPSRREMVGRGSSAYYRKPAGVERAVTYKPVGESSSLINVSTVSRWSKASKVTDVLLVDDAWQCSWGELQDLAACTSQFLLTGDPGQATPIYALDTGRWCDVPNAPHLPGPAVLARTRPDDCVELRMPETHRLGPATAHALSPLYETPVTSRRPDMHLEIDGQREPELRQVRVIATSTDHRAMHVAGARAAVRLASGILHVDGREPHLLSPARIAVAAADISDAHAVRARLPRDSAITVDTIDRLRGVEFDATVLLDPLAGRDTLADGDVANGLLCVGLSRHTATCTLVTTTAVDQALADANSVGSRISLSVRSAILENP